jgi:hypothetical protein
MKVMVCYIVSEMKKYYMKKPFYTFSIWDYASKNMNFDIHKSLGVLVHLLDINIFHINY